MAGFGENLRREREALGVSLEDISAATKISVRLLQAIEDEDFDRLPGGVFNINFVRQYARHLGLEEEGIISEYRRLTAPPVEPAAPQRVVPSEWMGAGGSDYEWDRQRRSQIWKFASFVVLTVGLVGALYLWWSGRKAAVEQAPAVAETPAPVSPPAQSPPAESKVPEAPPSATLPAPAAPAESHSAAPVQPAPSTASAPPVAPAAPAAPTDAPVRVDIQANETVWVAASTDGMPRFQTTLEPQQTRTVTAQASVRLRLGNAGGVTLLLNGVPQPAPGPKGQVRTVVLTLEGMQVIAPKPPEPESSPDAGAASEETARPQPKKKTDSPDKPNRG